MTTTPPTATPDPGATFPGSWCENCGCYVGKIAGTWVHLSGILLTCNPRDVERKRDQDARERAGA